jgi:hypothetical protein
MENKEFILKNIASDLILDYNKKPYYEDFDVNLYGDTLEPGSMPAPYFYESVITNIDRNSKKQPILGIEVGSFLGYSAIHFAKHMKKHNPNSKLICIDTWLGSYEHYLFSKNGNHGWDKKDYMQWKHGQSSLYHKFISNVILHDVQDIIVPLPFPSVTGFKILNYVFDKHDIKADFAYIDGSHEEDEVYMDLYHYYQLLVDGGWLCGDDWAWESVSGDVTKFCTNNNLTCDVHQNRVHWTIIK